MFYNWFMVLKERRQKDTWGLAFFLFSPAIIGGLIYLSVQLEPGQESALLRYTPLIGLPLSVLCFLAGHYAYSRVYNPKVYLCGHLAGVAGIIYFLPSLKFLSNIPLDLLLFISQLNLLFVLFLPAKTKFRVTKIITWALVLGELLLIWIIGFSPDLLSRVIQFFHAAGIKLKWMMLVWPLFILSMSFLLVKRQFHLGGIITGSSYFFTAAYLSALVKTQYLHISPVLVAAALFYILIGMALHAVSGMEHRACFDPLLQIFSRNYCSRIIEEQARLNTSMPFSVAMIDIDHFKKVNDTWGHQAGDRVLISIAKTIRNIVGRKGVLCRYGGEELVIFFPKTEGSELMPLMEKIRKSIEAMKIPVRSKKNISVTVSCGVSQRENLSQSIAEVIEAADRALYKAKESGRNKVCAAGLSSSRGFVYPVSRILTQV
jgi:diguanylate cyclase (GGDEF)-like protein